MISGGCLCGSVRYRYDGEPLFSVVCHCRDCQKASGSSRVPVMGATKASFHVEGTTKTYRSVGGSGKAAVRHFCPECGSLLFGMPEVVPDMVTIYVGSLDDPGCFAPDHAIYTRERLHWDLLADGIHQFETMPGAVELSA
jgi:hypothetical protein